MNLTKIALLAGTSLLAFGSAADSLIPGKAPLKSAGPLAFGPDAILFIGDSLGAQVVAVETNDHTPSAAAPALEVKGINRKIAAMLGTSLDQISVNDAVVNPVSKKIYLSVSRGHGPQAIPVILCVDTTGKIELLRLDNIRHATAAIVDPPAVSPTASPNPRLQSITEVRYLDGKVFVAGLSNEEFSSNMRAIPFPFQQDTKGAMIEIYHGSHGEYETNSPVRTFVPYTIGGQEFILASYTCTPLVKIPVSQLQPGAKVKGTTIAELGAGNRPLDMIAYKKNGHDFILMANSSRGVMKLQADHLETYSPITKPVAETEGVPYETIQNWKGVQQLDKVDEKTAMILASDGHSIDLRTVALP